MILIQYVEPEVVNPGENADDKTREKGKSPIGLTY